MQRVGLIAGAGVVLTTAVLLGTYEVQGKTMPDGLFWLVVIASLAVFCLAASLWLVVYLALPTWRFVQSLEFRSPVVSRNGPMPHQWLLDIADEDQDNPESAVSILSGRVRAWNVNARRPHIDLGITVFNGSVYTLFFGGAEGRADFRGDPLPEEIEDQRGGGHVGVPRKTSYEIWLRQYIPQDVCGPILKEIQSGTLESLRLYGVRVPIRAETESAPHRYLGLEATDGFTIRLDRPPGEPPGLAGRR
jgi:hypothetical protein